MPYFGKLRPLAVCLAAALLVSACGADPEPSAAVPTPSAGPSINGTEMPIEPVSGVEIFRELDAGTYFVDDPFPLRISFVLPAGWRTWAYTSAGSQINLVKPDLGEVSLEIVENVSADPCTSDLIEPPVGPSVDDLVTALSELDEFEASRPTDITINGFSGKQLTISAPSETECDSLNTWRTTTRQNGVGVGEINEVRIVDADGVRLVIAVAHAPSLPAAAQSEIDSVLDSIQIGP